MLNFQSLIIPFIKNFINILFFRKNYMIFKISEINSHSMEPNFHEGQYLLVKKISNYKKINRFDVLVHFCNIHSINHIKRVIGLPNERINFKGKNLFINDKLLKTFSNPDLINFEVNIDKKSFFLLSDNHSLFGISCDSIKTGPLEKEDVIGIVI